LYERDAPEVRAGTRRWDVEHFDADHFTDSIEVEDDPRLYLFRLDDIGFVQLR
jgi:hypothetical protein